MDAFRAGTAPATVMDRIAKGFTHDETRAIAAWWAAAEDEGSRSRGSGAGGRGPATRRAILAQLPSCSLPFLARAQTAARVVVVGGGFGGATAARFLRRADPRIDVTLVEANPQPSPPARSATR